MKPTATVQKEFDRIALLSEDDRANSSYYDNYLLRYIPVPCAYALEIGCGTGVFSRLLAARCGEVLALDVSPNMILKAKDYAGHSTNLTFQIVDVLTWKFPVQVFDCIVSIATLHHLPLEEIIMKMKDALRPGGTLLIIDLFEPKGPMDFLRNISALPVAFVLRCRGQLPRRSCKELRQAWTDHAHDDVFPSMSQVREICNRLLPGALVKQHLMWRYSVVWRKGTCIV